MSVISYPDRGGIPPLTWGRGGVAPGLQIRWFDRHGTILKTANVYSGQSVFAPSVPVVSGLSNGRWSESASNVSRPMDIVPIYDVTDGKCHVFLEASAIAGLTATVKVTKTDTSTLTIDWGDGVIETSTASGSVTLTHLYVAGSYEAKFSITSGTGDFSMGLGTTGNPFVAGVAVTELWMRPTSTSVPAFACSGEAFRTMVAVVGANAVTSIGASAFAANYALATIPIPEVLTIGDNAFVSAYALRALYAPKLTTLGASAIIQAYQLNCVYLPALVTIGASGLSSLFEASSIILPELTDLGSSGLNGNYFPSVLSLPKLATIGGTSISLLRLTTLLLPSAVSFATNALQSSRYVESITIGPNCTSIAGGAFGGARRLRTLRIEATTPPTLAATSAIADNDPRLVIQVPAASLAAYQAATNWSSFAARMVGF